MLEREKISEADKIRILLAEHSTLRAEIIARAAHAYQMIGFALAAVVLLVTLRPNPIVFWSMIAVIATVLPFGLWVFWREMLKEGQRVREIELDVNERAQEDLLVWENLWGGGVTGFFGLARPLPRSHLVGLSSPIRTWKGQELSTARTPLQSN